MTDDDITETIAALGRAIAALSGPKADVDGACREISDALGIARRGAYQASGKYPTFSFLTDGTKAL